MRMLSHPGYSDLFDPLDFPPTKGEGMRKLLVNGKTIFGDVMSTAMTQGLP